MDVRDKSPVAGRNDRGEGEPRLWEVSVNGTVEGPYEETNLIRAIESGQILKAQIRPKGELGWQILKSYPPFGAALRRAAQTQPFPVPPRSR
jgi:hypothetical protein